MILENYGVQEMNYLEKQCIDGGYEYLDWPSYPTDGHGNVVVTPGSILYVTGASIVVGAANAGIAVANGVSAAWEWLTS